MLLSRADPNARSRSGELGQWKMAVGAGVRDGDTIREDEA